MLVRAGVADASGRQRAPGSLSAKPCTWVRFPSPPRYRESARVGPHGRRGPTFRSDPEWLASAVVKRSGRLIVLAHPDERGADQEQDSAGPPSRPTHGPPASPVPVHTAATPKPAAAS